MLSTGTVAGSRRIQTGGYRGYDMDDVYPMLSMDLFGRPFIAKLRGNESLTTALCAVPQR
jgi:hypothetical protein